MPLLVRPSRAPLLLTYVHEAMAQQTLRATAPEDVPWPLARYIDDPVGFITEQLGEQLWSRQRDIAQALVDHRRVAVPTAHNLGKSFLAARIVAWWLATHRPGEAFAVTTAPTGVQVKAILWREIQRAHAKGQLPGRTNQSQWWIGREIVGMGRKPSDYDPTAFQGIHAMYVLVVIDEGCGVPESIWRAAGSLVSNEGSRELAIGNPDDPNSYFGKTVCQPASGWHIEAISAFDSPNFTGEQTSADLHDLLMGHSYERDLAREVGCSCDDLAAHRATPDCPAHRNPVYMSKVRGEFPEDVTDGVVPLSWVKNCQRLEEEPGQPVGLGMDVGAGGDETTIRERRGPVAGRRWHARTPNWSDSVAMALQAIDETGAEYINIDLIGIGWGTHGRLLEHRRDGRISCEVNGVNVGLASTKPSQFPRLRDQIWWEVGRELSRDAAWDLGQVDDATIAQLIAPKYYRDSANRVHVESKDELRKPKRLGRSPDDADALLLAYYRPAGVWFR